MVLAFGNDEFLIVDVKANEGKLTGTVPTQPMLGPLKTAEGTAKGDAVTIQVPGRGEPLLFHGVVGRTEKVRGNVRFSGRTYPAQLEKTEDKDGRQDAALPLCRSSPAQSAGNAKEQVAKILELIQENPGHPMNAAAYAALLGSAEAAGLGPEEVRRRSRSGPTRPDRMAPSGRPRCSRAPSRRCRGRRRTPRWPPRWRLAADKALPADAALELRGTIVTMLARSARLAGKDEIAAEAESLRPGDRRQARCRVPREGAPVQARDLMRAAPGARGTASS